VIYYAFFYSAMELYFGETISIIFKTQKRQLELWNDAGIEFCVENYLRNYKFCL